MLESLVAVPKEIWAALVASIVTLFGVLVTIRLTHNQFALQLEHDYQIRDRERAMSLRRDIFFDAISEIHNRQGYLLNLVNLEDSSGSNEPGDNALAKLELIAGDETVTAAHSLDMAYVEALFLLNEKRVRLVNDKNSIDVIQNIRDETWEKYKAYGDRLTQLTIEGGYDEAQWKSIENWRDFEKGLLEEYDREKEEKWQQFLEDHSGFLLECMKGFSAVAEKTPPVVLAIRRELEMPLDEASYLVNHRKSIERAQTLINRFSQTLKAEYAESNDKMKSEA